MRNEELTATRKWWLNLDHQEVRNVATSGFTWTNDFDNLPAFKAKVTRHQIVDLNSHQLARLEVIAGQKFHLLVARQNNMLRD